ncbi:hypothetical protein B2J93_7241 [Marssonina coronariae]|uniref:Uncharacterized protein n=1 Tax=Diplocarpon coronariae TaxID=2795749 RepID=A0A218Z7S1_9HELO|nr:hypothetical protein B2J93_7241 [Marssonina coronariae]
MVAGAPLGVGTLARSSQRLLGNEPPLPSPLLPPPPLPPPPPPESPAPAARRMPKPTIERDNACEAVVSARARGASKEEVAPLLNAVKGALRSFRNGSDRTLVPGGPATPASSSIATSPAPNVPFPFAPSPSGLDPFAPIAAAAPVPSASAIAAAAIVSPFVSLAPAVAAPVLAAAPAALAPVAPAAPPAFAPAVAGVFAGGPLAEGVPVGLSQEEIRIELLAMASRLLALARRI